ncbi:MAG: hypothetical protein PHO02_03155 [Candidatus Nanoarchaeia archaeon]|nr:hypothetical protein [Candidatus Nanoarchaeia archaeon]
MAKRSQAKETNKETIPVEEHEKPDMPKLKGNDVTLSKMAEALVETNIALQHKVADLILNLKDTNKSMKEMVTLFTEAGEHIKKGKYEDPLIVKLDELLDQNKNIAKGLLLLEKFVREKQAPTGFQRPFQKTEL